MSDNTLRKTPNDRLIFGVCGGLGKWAGVSSVWFRLAFFLAFIGFGLGAILYVLLAILMPTADEA